MTKAKLKSRFRNLGTLIEVDGKTYRIANYKLAFPKEEVILDPVEEIGESRSIPLADLFKYPVITKERLANG